MVKCLTQGHNTLVTVLEPTTFYLLFMKLSTDSTHASNTVDLGNREEYDLKLCWQIYCECTGPSMR